MTVSGARLLNGRYVGSQINSEIEADWEKIIGKTFVEVVAVKTTSLHYKIKTTTTSLQIVHTVRVSTFNKNA